jgi:molybdate transport system permease protein
MPPGPTETTAVRAVRSRWFMVWMIGLGSFYLLLIAALLAGNVQYMHGEAAANVQSNRPAATAPPTWSDYASAWGEMLRGALLNKNIIHAAELSFVTSTLTAALSLLVGIPTAYILARRKFWGITLIDTLLDIPILLPPLVIGISLLIFFQTDLGRWINRGFPGELVGQPAGIVLAQFVVACAFGIRMMKATFEQIDPRVEAVARTLGASKGQAFFRLTLPMSRDGILAAGVLTWARAVGEFGPVLTFVGTTRMRTEVLPTSVFLEFSVGHLTEALAVSLLMIVISVATLLVFKKLMGIRFL